VHDALRRDAGTVARCGRGHAALVRVDVVVEGATGRVIDVTVEGLAFTETGACVERAVRTARFPTSREPMFEVRAYPFALQ
jgi:hypothetical protein